MRKRETETETQAEGEAGSMQGARHGTWSQVPRIMPWAGGGAEPLSHLGCPLHWILKGQQAVCLDYIVFCPFSVSLCLCAKTYLVEDKPT